ncbi:PilZ domain-containing protein [PVC group bacterium]|nr:PilZ domain-containing protein [PVC group bacterium]
MKFREFIRHPSNIPIDIQLADVAVDTKDYLDDISVGGLSFRSKVTLKEGAIIHIKIPLVDPVFQVKATVVWCRKTKGEYHVGVKFVNPQDENRIRMVEQICYIEQYKKEIFQKEGRVLTGEEAALEWIGKYADKFPNYIIYEDTSR